MRILACLATLAALSGCAPSPAEAPAPAARAPLHAFSFFVSDLRASDPRIVEHIQSDCGIVAVARVARIPTRDELILPDVVVQYDENGAQVHRWSKSYSSEILAISGDQLYFGASPGGDAGPFRTTPAGDVTVAVPLASNLEADASYVACPESLEAFPDMSLVSCYQTADVAGRKLWLAWEAGCPADTAAAPQ